MSRQKSKTIRFPSSDAPFWSFHPACLACNWDHGEWTYAAHVGPRPPRRKWPEWFANREWVAWLCEDCAEDENQVQWFVDTVISQYPNAGIVWQPGTVEETDVSRKRNAFLAEHLDRRRGHRK